MENNRPVHDPSEAADVLAALDDDQRAVRDTPWPLWLYPVNSALLVAMGLSFQLPDRHAWVLLLAAITMIGANLFAGRLNGAPFALPTSRTFLTLVVLSIIPLIGARAAAREFDSAGANVALSAASGLIYAVASWVHHRSTRGEGTR